MAFRVGEQDKDITVYFVDEEDDGIDVSAATTKTIRVRKPSGTVVDLVASFVSGGTGGGITYNVDSAAFFTAAEVGTWKVEGKVAGTGFVWYTEIGQFEVVGTL